jgi:hypothetical protein
MSLQVRPPRRRGLSPAVERASGRSTSRLRDVLFAEEQTWGECMKPAPRRAAEVASLVVGPARVMGDHDCSDISRGAVPVTAASFFPVAFAILAVHLAPGPAVSELFAPVGLSKRDHDTVWWIFTLSIPCSLGRRVATAG